MTLESPTTLQDAPLPSEGSGLRRWLPTLVLLAVFAVYMGVGRAPAELKGWSTDFEAATAQASAGDRNLLVSFYMHGCPPCDAMDRTVLPTAKVRDAIANLVPVRVDINKNYDLADRYGIYATPTYVIAQPNGKLLASTMGYHSVDEFVKFVGSAGTATGAQETSSTSDLEYVKTKGRENDYTHYARKQLTGTIQIENSQPRRVRRDTRSGTKWYEGGSLLRASALKWQTASGRDKLATCAVFVSTKWQKGNLKPSIARNLSTLDDVRPYAQELVVFLDAALKPHPDHELNRKMFTNQTVAGLAAAGMITMGWTR